MLWKYLIWPGTYETFQEHIYYIRKGKKKYSKMAEGKTNEGIFPSKCSIKSFLTELRKSHWVLVQAFLYLRKFQKIREASPPNSFIWFIITNRYLYHPHHHIPHDKPIFKMQCPLWKKFPRQVCSCWISKTNNAKIIFQNFQSICLWKSI